METGTEIRREGGDREGFSGPTQEDLKYIIQPVTHTNLPAVGDWVVYHPMDKIKRSVVVGKAYEVRRVNVYNNAYYCGLTVHIPGKGERCYKSRHFEHLFKPQPNETYTDRFGGETQVPMFLHAEDRHQMIRTLNATPVETLNFNRSKYKGSAMILDFMSELQAL